MTLYRGPDHPLTIQPPARPRVRTSRHVVSRVALWAGRALLVGGPLLVAARVATAPAPHRLALTAAELDANPWLLVPFAVVVSWFATLPLLVLPFGSVHLTRIAGRQLVVRTVLGTRRLPLPAEDVGLAIVRNVAWGETYFLGIRRGWRWVVVVASDRYPFPDDLVRDVGNFGVDPSRDRRARVAAGSVLALGWALAALAVTKGLLA
jgi:hypothetical protein